jgi:hypothetical protein
MMAPGNNPAVALGVGLLICLERERCKGEGPTGRPAGPRIFAPASRLGGLAVHLGGHMLVAGVVAGVGSCAALSYLRGQATDPGLTTDIGWLTAPLLGGVAIAD